MSAPLSNNLHLSSALKISEGAMVSKKQGIVSILAVSDGDQGPLNKAASLRRTLSADMSSKKWLSQHGFSGSPLKKIASTERFPAVSIMDSSSEEGEEHYDEGKESDAPSQFDVWASIQQEKKQKEKEKSGPFDIWSSIVSHKSLDESSKSALPPPYIHPLVKRSASSLSKKSLEICTESLGSETGSDGFSSYPPSETSDMEEDNNKEEEQERVPAQACSFEEETIIVKYNYDVGKKSTHRSFPPPIPSLSNRDGASVRMKTHRDNGRLVVEAVSVPSQNNFLAQRKDGRLVLTFANPNEAESMINEATNVEGEERELEELEEEFESFGEEEEEGEVDDEEESEIEIDGVKVKRWYEMEEAPKLSSGVINVHRLAVMMNKPIWLANRNSPWHKNFDEIVKLGEEKEINPTTQPSLAQSLPPRPPPSTTAASFNSYEYSWRSNQPMSKSAILNQLAPPPPPKDNNINNQQQQQLILSKNLMANNDQQKLLVLRGNKVDYFVPLLKGCKEPRRSLLFWEPYCIATS